MVSVRECDNRSLKQTVGGCLITVKLQIHTSIWSPSTQHIRTLTGFCMKFAWGARTGMGGLQTGGCVTNGCNVSIPPPCGIPSLFHPPSPLPILTLCRVTCLPTSLCCLHYYSWAIASAGVLGGDFHHRDAPRLLHMVITQLNVLASDPVNVQWHSFKEQFRRSTPTIASGGSLVEVKEFYWTIIEMKHYSKQRLANLMDRINRN